MDLLALRARTRTKADEGNTDFIDNTKLDASINAACRFVYRKLVKKSPDKYRRVGTTGNGNKFDTVAETAGYAYATDLMNFVRVEARSSTSTSDNDYLPVDKLNIGGQEGVTFYPIREGYLPHFGYFIAGASLYFRPVPTQAFTVRIWDIPKFTALSATTDEPVFDEDWHELVSELAALDLLGTSGEPLFNERFKMFEIQNGLLEDTASHMDERGEVMCMDFNEVGVMR